MQRPLLTEADIPLHASVILHDPIASLILTWKSDRGLHIVRTDIPMAWCQEEGHEEQVLQAVRTLEQALILEALELE